MAKKMLINADMLLATPRSVEKQATVIQEVKTEEKPRIPQSIVAPEVEAPVVEKIAEAPQAQVVEKKEASSVQKGLKAGETRATFIVQETALDKIKAIAYWDRCNIKDVINTAFDQYIKEYEQKNGAVQNTP
jgi:hypothetical protein